MTWRPLSEIALTIRGVSFDKAEAATEANGARLPILRAGNIQSELRLDSDLVWIPSHRVAPTQRLQPNDIVMCASSGSAEVVGKSAILDRAWNGSFGAFCLGIRADPAICLPAYLAFYLKSRAFKAWARQAQGINIKNLRKSELDQLPIPITPMERQRRIVDILTRAASIRRLRNQAKAKIREIVPALFVDMFGDPATNPKRWDISELGTEIEAFQGGKNVAAGDSEVDGRGLRILKVSAVTSGEFDPTESKPAPPDFDAPPSYYVRKGDVLISRANTVELVGAAALVTTEPHGLLLPDKIWRIVWKKNSRLYPQFLLSYLQNQHVRSLMSQMATGTSGSMKNISQAKLVTLPIYIPPLHLQKEFAARTGELEVVGSLSERASVIAHELFNALQHQAFG